MSNRKTAIVAVFSFLTVTLLLWLWNRVPAAETLSGADLKDHIETAREALDGNPGLEEEITESINGALTRVPIEDGGSISENAESSTGDWEDYPLSDAHPIYGLIAGTIKAENLFRCKYLNPRDVVLPLSHQDRIREVIRLRVPSLKKMMDLAHEIMTKELVALIETGKARHVSYNAWYASLDEDTKSANEAKREEYVRSVIDTRGLSESDARKEAEGMRFPHHAKMFGFIPYGVRSTGDDFYAAELRELPRTLDLRHAFVLAALDITHQLGAIYQEALALTDNEFSELVERSGLLLDRLFPDLNFK